MIGGWGGIEEERGEVEKGGKLGVLVEGAEEAIVGVGAGVEGARV
jgi:hypothetical protein